MLPYLQEGDWIIKESVTSTYFAEKFPLSVGDVVVFRSPLNKEASYVKRVIALVRELFQAPNLDARHLTDHLQTVLANDCQEGDLVPVKSEQVRLPNSIDYDGHSIRVPANAVWVEGDNKVISQDSRYFGPIPADLITYKVYAKFWPKFRRLYDPWLVRLLHGNVTWTEQHAPSTTLPDK